MEFNYPAANRRSLESSGELSKAFSRFNKSNNLHIPSLFLRPLSSSSHHHHRYHNRRPQHDLILINTTSTMIKLNTGLTDHHEPPHTPFKTWPEGLRLWRSRKVIWTKLCEIEMKDNNVPQNCKVLPISLKLFWSWQPFDPAHHKSDADQKKLFHHKPNKMQNRMWRRNNRNVLDVEHQAFLALLNSN